MLRSPPPAATRPTTTAHTAAAGTTTSRHGRRATAKSGNTSAPGATLIHAPIVKSTAASRGRPIASTSATIANGTAIASSRPNATGPSSARYAIHHIAPSHERRTRAIVATALTTVTRPIHAAAYGSQSIVEASPGNVTGSAASAG